MDISIEPVNGNHFDTVQRLIAIDQEAFGQGGLNEWTLVPLIRHGRVFAAYQGELIVGCAQFMKDWQREGTAYLVGVAVSKEHRGLGIGLRLLQSCLEYLKEAGICFIELTVSPDNVGAIKLYQEKLGFRFTVMREGEYGLGENRWVMVCEL